VLLALVVLVAFQRSRGAIRLVPAAEAPAVGTLTLLDTAGRTHSMHDRRGRVVVLNLWASWCGPCRREVPRLSRLHRDFESEGLTVWAINAEAFGGEELQRVAAELGIDYPAMTAVGRLDAALAGGQVLPFTWLIDRQGKVRAAHGGVPAEWSLRRACRKLLEEPVEALAAARHGRPGRDGLRRGHVDARLADDAL